MDAFSATYAVRKLMDFVFQSGGKCVSNLGNLIGERMSLFLGLENLINKLESDLRLVQLVLADAEEKQASNSGVRMWLQQLKDFVYDVEDIFDELEIEVVRNPVMRLPEDVMNRTKGKVLSAALGDKRAKSIRYCKHILGKCFCLGSTSTTSPQSNVFVTRLVMADRIKELIDAFEKILVEMTKYNLMAKSMTEQESSQQQQQKKRRETTCIGDAKFLMVGRDQDKNILINKLLDRDEGHQSYVKPNVSLLSIVGMGGIGKSTLAYSIFNDSSVKSHFKTMKWVSVGETFEPLRLIKDLVDEEISVDSTLQCLQMKLKNKGEDWGKFLVVLDDVWNEDTDNWNDLWNPLTYGVEGSKVLVTCRSKEVIRITSNNPTIVLKELDYDYCLSIFNRHAFSAEDLKFPPKLITIGEKIVKELGGLPLAAKVVGSYLYGKYVEETWTKYLNDKPWLYKDGSIMGALIWSFSLMPTHLKQCFGYCCLLSKGKAIDKKDLIRKWIASGLIDSQARNKLEDVGLEYFNTLVQLSFIEVASKPHLKAMYVMHDLIHDLAQLVASPECKVLGVKKYQKNVNNEQPHHLIFDDIDAMGKKNYQKIRTAVAMLTKSSIPKLNDFLPKLKYVRILDITHYLRHRHECKGVKEIPFSCLIHLRYLKVPCSGYLSDSATDLHKLQYLLCLIDHVDIHLGHMRKLVNLHSLGVRFIVGKESGYKIEELGDLQELRGSLCIKNLERVESKEDAMKGGMNNKENLKKLILMWSECFANMHIECEQVLEGLVPHNNIQVLTIDGYMGIQFASWVADSMALHNLQKMKLRNCGKVKSLPALGQLPQLKKLYLYNLDEVCSIGQEFYGTWNVESSIFSSLKELDIDGLDNLTAWLGKKWHFPSLCVLRIDNCGKLSSIPLGFSVLQNLAISRCQALNTYLESLCGRKIEAGANIHLAPVFPVLKYLRIDSVQLLDNIQGNAHAFCNASTLENICLWSSTEMGEEFWGPEKSNDGKGDQWKEFTSLRRLTFVFCRSLVYLPPHLHRLPSLEVLEIRYCDRIEAMPSGGLPKSLQRLNIWGSSSSPLKTRCEKDTGLDWPKISHVPELDLHW